MAASIPMSRPLAALATALLLAGCSAPGAVEARAFSTGFKAGESIRYQVHTTVAGSLLAAGRQLPVNSDQTLSERLEVRSVDASGTATVAVTIEDVVSAATGGSAATNPAPVTLTIGSDGRIRSGSAAPLGGRVPSIPGSDQLTPVWPSHAVRPGDGWDESYDRPNPYGGGSLQFTGHQHYLRDESISGRQAAVIDSTLRGPIDFTIDFARLPAGSGSAPPSTGPIHYTGSITTTTRYWVDLATEQVLKSTGSGSYELAYATAAAAGQAAAPEQVTFNGTIGTEVERV